MADKPEEIKINPNTTVGSLYSQFVGITVTDTEVTLEFVYINPRTKNEGQVIARITLPRKTAESLSNAITTTVRTHENKKKN